MTIDDKLITDCLETIRKRISENIDTTGTRASGKTQASMQIVKTEKGYALVGRQYFQSVEEGRPSGKVPYDFQSILKQWAKDKGIFFSTERELNSFTWLLKEKIRNEGTKLFRDGGRTDIYTDVIEEEIENLKQDIFIKAKSEIVNSLKSK